ncbi:MAG: hypothetical protein ACSLFK_04495 [Gemmatimonadaceae bacterium]
MAISRRVLASAILLSALPPGVASAQPVLLRIRPHAGDTLSVRMEQRVEMTGVPAGCATGYAGGGRAAKSVRPQRECSDSTRQMTSVMQVFSKAIVSRVTGNGAVILAVTDSVRSSLTSGSGPPAPPRKVSSSRAGIEMIVATDGGAEVLDADASDELRAVFGQMPATLSRRPVAVGETWVRRMRIPISTEAGATSLVTATFRLDSLGRNGDIAHISMKGTLSHDHRDGSDSERDGWLTGTMQLDRRLAWITDTRAVIDVESMVKPTTGGDPMRVRTRITQALSSKPLR